MAEVSAHVSVALAARNGALFIQEQVASVLAELGAEDELIVVDDASTDETLTKLSDCDDPRVRLIASPHRLGHVGAFSLALEASTGAVVFLSDQDDVWVPGRLQRMCQVLQSSGAGVVAGGLRTFGEGVEPSSIALPQVRVGSRRWWAAFLLGRLPYFGSAMGCTRAALEVALPVPTKVEAHDHWLAVIGASGLGLVHVEEPVTWRRIHGRNATPHRRRRLRAVLRTRLIMLQMALIARRRCASYGHGDRARRGPGAGRATQAAPSTHE